MRRRLYFLLDRLQIRRSERIAVTALLVPIALLSTLLALHEPEVYRDPEELERITQIFNERSARIEAEEQELLTRYIPSVYLAEAVETESGSAESLLLAAATDPSQKVNINKAEAEELQTLPGIGPAYAERIIEWRNKNGPFKRIDQLLEIRGIGERRLEALKPLVTLGDEPEVTNDP